MNYPTALITQGNTLTDPKYKVGEALKTFDYMVANVLSGYNLDTPEVVSVTGFGLLTINVEKTHGFQVTEATSAR